MPILSVHRRGRSMIARLFPPPHYLLMPAVGVDISDSSVKFAEFIKSGDGLRLGRYGERSIPDGVVVKGMIQKVEALADILRALKREMHITFIRASLPEEHAYIFQTHIPDETPEDQLRTILEFQLEEHVPIAPRDAVFDYEVINRSKEGHLDAIVEVFSKNVVGSYLEAFKRAGLLPLSLEVEASAAARAVIRKGDLGTFLLVDFGNQRTGIAVVSGGRVSFTSTVGIGGQPISTAIKKNLGVAGEDVDRVKNEQGIIREKSHPELFMTIMGTASVLKDEINKHLIYWRTRRDDTGGEAPHIERLILCGGSSNLAGLAEYLATSLRVPTELGNVWLNAFSLEDVIPDIDRAHSLSYATSVGLALRVE